MYICVRIICVWCFRVFGRTFLYKLQWTALLPIGRNEHEISLDDRVGGRCIIMPNFVKIRQSIARYHDFSIIQDGGCRHDGYLNFLNFIGWWVRRTEMSYGGKFHHNRSKYLWDITIFEFFKMAAATFLDFRNSQILLTDGFCRAKMHHHAKFRQNPSIHCGVILIFWFFKMAAVAILDFFNSQFLFQMRSWGSRCITVPHFVKIGQTLFEISRFSLFFKMVATAILNFRKSQILLAEGAWRAEMHHLAKLRKNTSIHCRVIAIFFDF